MPVDSRTKTEQLDTIKGVLTIPCCDLCYPSLLSRTRPGKPPAKQKRKAAIKKSDEPFLEVQKKLREWRQKTHKRDLQHTLIGASALLPNAMINDIASVGPIADLKRLEEVLGGRWGFIRDYGEQIVKELSNIVIPEVGNVPKASKRRRKVTGAEDGADEDGNPVKRARGDGSGDKEVVEAPVQEASGFVNLHPQAPYPYPPAYPYPTIQQPPHFTQPLYQQVWMNGPGGMGWYNIPIANHSQLQNLYYQPYSNQQDR
ncbi:hypothetical protein D9758_018504 [Tetrapyrgos nigripes]|uniref:Uncharacterized protein n=1 Tax=Tetrapyrgos nigripes TaxID=182062 RepID=A0A8H5FEQ7_9AGAR|nr:hypothetical protein D9758_018504 [Tetrapyrgos nigripes]